MRRSAAVRHLNGVKVSKMAIRPSVTIPAVVVASPQQSFLRTFSAWNTWSWIIDAWPVVKLHKRRIFLWQRWTQSFTNICIFEKLAHAGYQDSFPLLTGTEELKAVLSWRTFWQGSPGFSGSHHYMWRNLGTSFHFGIKTTVKTVEASGFTTTKKISSSCFCR